LDRICPRNIFCVGVCLDGLGAESLGPWDFEPLIFDFKAEKATARSPSHSPAPEEIRSTQTIAWYITLSEDLTPICICWCHRVPGCTTQFVSINVCRTAHIVGVTGRISAHYAQLCSRHCITDFSGLQAEYAHPSHRQQRHWQPQFTLLV